MALVLLADGWARGRGGQVVGLIVDHGLRGESTAEAALTRARLAARGIAARVLTLHGLRRGPALAARARAARYAALDAACAEAGILHLLLGHHAADQAETVAMRRQRGSGPAGLAAMPALVETARLRLLRPLLTVPPVMLRRLLLAQGVGWVEDPSNADPTTLRAQLRAAHDDPDGTGAAVQSAVAASLARGSERGAGEWLSAARLAARLRLYPQGYALLMPGDLPAAALGPLLRLLAGADWAPAPRQLVGRLHAATLGGVRILPAGRLLPGGWLLVREAAALGPPVPARRGAVWDRRFRLVADAPGCMLGALGPAAAGLRRKAPWPAAVLMTLPALWRDGVLASVPHLGYGEACAVPLFSPPAPLAGAPFRSGFVVRGYGWGCQPPGDTLC